MCVLYCLVLLHGIGLHRAFCSQFHDAVTFLVREAQYSNYIRKQGVYIGLPDIALYAESRGKTAMALFYDNERPELVPKVVPICESLNSLLAPIGDVEKFKVPENVDFADNDVWVLAACRSDYTRGQFVHLNHWVPCFPKSKFGDAWSDEVSKHQDQKFDFG